MTSLKTSASLTQTAWLAFFTAATTQLAFGSVANSPLGSDWQNQAYANGGGFKVDVRYDFNNQNQPWSGKSAVSTWPVAGTEQELQTLNQIYTVSLDYSDGKNWGLNVQLPYIFRTHDTNGFVFDGSDAGSAQHQGLGDIKVVARAQIEVAEQTLGLQAGAKLATGNTTQVYTSGALAGTPLARSLQLGTGTTDSILGLYLFGKITSNFDYYAQGLYQSAASQSQGYRPGDVVNATLGFRYLGNTSVVPMIQFNACWIGQDAGVNADVANSGGQALFVSPGLAVPVAKYFNAYLFWELPVYQNYNGYQLVPRSHVTLGGRFDF